jgi:hypothetical protein
MESNDYLGVPDLPGEQIGSENSSVSWWKEVLAQKISLVLKTTMTKKGGLSAALRLLTKCSPLAGTFDSLRDASQTLAATDRS